MVRVCHRHDVAGTASGIVRESCGYDASMHAQRCNNVALGAGDSVERHFMDTVEGGAWLPDQELVWTLVTCAVERVRELENELGCFFDRNPDGTLHQKAFAGQTFDRTVHKGDLTGIEIINRLAEQVWVAGVERLEEHRAVEIVRSADGRRGAGVVMIDMREADC